MNELLFVYLYSLSNQFVRGTPLATIRASKLPSFSFELCGKPMLWHASIKSLGRLDWFRSPLKGIAELGSVNISSVVSKS